MNRTGEGDSDGATGAWERDRVRIGEGGWMRGGRCRAQVSGPVKPECTHKPAHQQDTTASQPTATVEIFALFLHKGHSLRLQSNRGK